MWLFLAILVNAMVLTVLFKRAKTRRMQSRNRVLARLARI